LTDEERIANIERSLEDIQRRNKTVEIDKSWEVSNSRKLIITALTYIIIVAYMYTANIQNPWLNSIIPALAFMLSTLTLPLFKKIWTAKTKN